MRRLICYLSGHISLQGNLSWTTTEDRIREILETVAPVVSLELQYHGETGRSKGWG